MSKRALVVIAIIIALPLLVTLFAYCSYCADNPVVATYGGDVRIIIYEEEQYHAVDGEGEYMFRFGEYLGRINDRTFGASLYRVMDDESGEYLAIADGQKRILYTRSGELEDGVRSDESELTRVVLDNFAIIEENTENIALLSVLDKAVERVSIDMSAYVGEDGEKLYEYYDVYFSFDGSAIVTEHNGRILHMTEKNKWYYVTNQALEEALSLYGESVTETTYSASPISDVSTIKLLMSYASGDAQTENFPEN